MSKFVYTDSNASSGSQTHFITNILQFLAGNSLNEASNSLTIIQSTFVHTDSNTRFDSPTQFLINTLKSLPVIFRKTVIV
jgi:hypothetical protein